jgi:hypothetical protein
MSAEDGKGNWVSNRVQVRIYEDGKLVHTHELTGPVELGRQNKGEEEPFRLKMEAGRRRLIIARYDEQNIPRRYILIERISSSKVRLKNLSATRPLQLPDVGALGHEESCEVSLPAVVAIGKLALRIQEVETEDVSLHGLAATKRLAPSGHAVLDVDQPRR